jgi:hypothetical protein
MDMEEEGLRTNLAAHILGVLPSEVARQCPFGTDDLFHDACYDPVRCFHAVVKPQPSRRFEHTRYVVPGRAAPREESTNFAAGGLEDYLQYSSRIYEALFASTQLSFSKICSLRIWKMH